MSENDRPRPFSEREGFAQPPAQQIDSMSDELRTCLWNALYNFLNRFDLDARDYEQSTHDPIPFQVAEHFCLCLWVDFFNQPEDQFPTRSLFLRKSFKSLFEEIEWYRVYDLIEFILDECDESAKERQVKQYVSLRAKDFCEACENCLKKHNSAYRICGRKVVPITSKQEIAEIDSAMNSEHLLPSDHIRKALSLFANRLTPDYPNSIKESISAVESLAKIVAGKEQATLGELTRELGELHPAFQQALGKLYGYTSDAQGIRHGAFDNPAQIRQEDARFMLVICSAFVNYIEAKRRD